jgi:hypothetical protein
VHIAGLNQDLTYWAPGQENQFGVKTHNAPILLKGRWQDVTEEVHTVGGNVVNAKAIVYPDRDLAVNGYLAKGDQTAHAEPTALPGAAEILAYFEDPDLRSVSKVRKAVL